jgi:hypothetical protein
VESNIKKIFISLLLSFLWSTQTYALGYCTNYENDQGVIDFGTTDNGNAIDANGCAIAPDLYTLTIYEIGVCTAAPTAPTITDASDFSTCTTIFTNEAGAVTDISVNTSIDLDASIDLPFGVYGSGYVILSNTLGITKIVNLTRDSTDPNAVSDNAGNPGQYCWTNGGTRYNSSSVWTVDKDAVAREFMECSDTAGTAQMYNEILDELGELPFTPTVYESESIAVNDGTMNAYITTTSGLLASAQIEGRIQAVIALTTPLVISDSTSAIDVQFTANQAGQPVIVGPNPGLTIVGIGSGPFSVNITSE